MALTGTSAPLDPLLEEHATAIQTLLDDTATALADARAKCPALEFDDIFLLRYLLSNDADVAKAGEQLRKGLAWRVEHAAVVAAVARGDAPPLHATIAPYCVADFAFGTREDAPVYVVRTGLGDPRRLMDACTPEQVLAWLMYQKERAFQRCDALTRGSRRLVKMVNVVDFAHLRWSLWGGSNDPRFFKVMGASSKTAEYVYPQLLNKSVMINLPRFFSVIYAFVKPFIPARTRKKINICPGRPAALQQLAEGAPVPSTSDISRCPFVKAWARAADVPAFLGGGARGKGTEMGRVTVKAGRRHAVTLAVARGSEVRWSLEVEAHGVVFSASLTPATTAAAADADANTDAGDGGGVEDEGAVVQLHGPVKQKSAEGVVEGVWQVDRDGELRVEFSNAHSKVKAKTIRFRLVVCNNSDSSSSSSANGGE